MSKKKKKKLDQLEQLQDEIEVDTLFHSLSQNEGNETRESKEQNQANIFQREIDHPKAMRRQNEQEEN